jgi:hypothetical protein
MQRSRCAIDTHFVLYNNVGKTSSQFIMKETKIRHPRTVGDRRAAAASPEFTRAKRDVKNLPSDWSDKPVCGKGRKPKYKDHQ